MPLADVFNHKAAYVRLTGDYVVAGDVPLSDGECHQHKRTGVCMGVCNITGVLQHTCDCVDTDESSSESNDGSGDNEEAAVHRDICDSLAEGGTCSERHRAASQLCAMLYTSPLLTALNTRPAQLQLGACR